MSQIVHEKLAQAQQLLAEFDLDCWLTFVRETAANMDPVLPLIYGTGVTWQSAFIVGRKGERIAILGRFDSDTARALGAYSQVIPYDQGIRKPLLQALERLNPTRIGINYSRNDPHADGLGHGLYLLLLDYLEGTPFRYRLCSAEALIAALRGRKTATELARIRQAIRTTEEIYARTFEFAQVGMSEREVAAFVHQQVDALGLETAWERERCPAVDAGPDTVVGHAAPSDIRIQPGHLVHFDFGVRQEGYCSDLQRMVYFLRPDETEPPAPVQHGFDTVVRAIQAAVAAMRPGIPGYQVDAAARRVVTEAGYPEYLYATGHQVGRAAHDGGTVLGPRWERYGDTPERLLAVDEVYAVEPGLMVPGYGYVGIEENVLVTESGAIFLSTPQTKLVVKTATQNHGSLRVEATLGRS